jgi:superfamily I DNA/RNA helicase
VHRLDLKYKPGTSENRYFIDRNDACWNNLLTTGNEPEFACATIHEAKGREYSAVCVVIPPDSRDLRRTEQLFVSWSDRTDDEAKRVIYVAITRAKKLGAVAIPSAYRDRLSAILEANQTDWQEHLV